MVPALARYLRSHHVGLVALFIALGGTAYAATLPRNSVGPKQLKRGAVTSAKVRDGALRPADFAPGALRSGPQGPAGPGGLTGPRGSDATFGTMPAAAVRQGPGDAQTLAEGPVVDVGNGATGKLTFEGYDTAALHETVTNPDRFAVSRTGVYLLSASATFAADPDGTRSLGFRLDGLSAAGRVQVPAVGVGSTPLATSAIIALTAGEFATLTAGVSGAGNTVDLSDVVFAIQWLGPMS